MADSYKIIPGKNMFERSMVSSMKMNEATWLRHANPWSVWTRFSCLPLIVLAIWSRQWLDIWFIAPLAAAIIWTWINPRVFPVPKSFNHWPAKATFGERVWLNRLHVPIANHHQRAALILTIMMFPALAVMAYGLYDMSLWPTLGGMILSMILKVWFCDRMVWLYEDMRKKNPVYASWAQRPENDNSEKKAA
ncbi:MAG: DUF6653 family protein [Hyphomicrobiales bacterium]